MQSYERDQTPGRTNPLEGRADIRRQFKASAVVVLDNAPVQSIDTALEGLIGIVREHDDQVVSL